MRYVYFFYPLFFYAIISYIFIDINPMPNDGYLILKSYIGYALLINFHTAFTFYNFSFNRNYKDLILDRYGTYTKFVFKYSTIFLGFVTIFWLIIFYGHRISTQMMLLLFSITGFLNLHHHLSQAKGLSNFYFFKKNKNKKEVFSEFVSEKKLYSALVMVTGLGIIVTYTSFFIKNVHIARLAFSSIVLTIVILILFNSYRLKNLFGFEKFLFQLRFIVYPLVVYFGAIPGDIFLSVTHGIEYTSLNSKIIKNEKTFHAKKLFIYLFF